MPAHTNSYRKQTAADLLADIRQSEAQTESGTTSLSASSTPQYIIGPLGVLEEETQLADSVIIMPDAVSDTYQLMQDSVNATDALAQSTTTPSKYSMPGRGFITQLGDKRFYGRRAFVSGYATSCHGFVPTAPIVIGFWQLGS